MSKSPSVFGGAMIIAGTAIGAGMLANPTATAGVWFSWSLLVFAYTWLCMYASGLMILEASTTFPRVPTLQPSSNPCSAKAGTPSIAYRSSLCCISCSTPTSPVAGV
nr:aromatic amino acid transport family protein [Moraxella bovis]